MRIAQISDIHTGSFFNKTAVKGGVEMMMREKADVIFLLEIWSIMRPKR